MRKLILLALFLGVSAPGGVEAWTGEDTGSRTDFADSISPLLSDGVEVPAPSPAIPAPRPGPAADTVVLVHGFSPLEENFDPLEAELQRRGYSVLRFEYDSEQSLEKSADELVLYISALRAERCLESVKIIAHSMGGLVSRRALIKGRELTLADSGLSVELATLASPFGGFSSANFIRFVPVNIFGITESFRYLGNGRSFISRPGVLGENVCHFKIETDERGQTRVDKGTGIPDDKVLPVSQANKAVDSDPALKGKKTLMVGHTAIISNDGRVSPQLINLLDELAPRLP